MRAEINLQDHYTFSSTARHHTFYQDTGTAIGGKDKGPTPKEYLLASIIGCSGMDIVGLIKKFRQNVTDLKISAEADQTDQHPRVFKEVMVHVEVKGEGLDAAKLKEAVDLSFTRYCGVSAMVAKVVPIKYQLTINGEKFATGEANFD